VTQSAGQSVFASSVAASRASAAASPSARSVVGDLQSGFGSAVKGSASTPAFAGSSSASPAGGAGSTAIGMAVLGLGLMGVLATSLVAVAQRRRAHGEVRSSRRAEGGSRGR